MEFTITVSLSDETIAKLARALKAVNEGGHKSKPKKTDHGIPSPSALLPVTLRAVADQEGRGNNAIMAALAKALKLTEAQKAFKTSNEPRYRYNAHWSLTWLRKANLVKNIGRANPALTDEGRKALAWEPRELIATVQERIAKRS